MDEIKWYFIAVAVMMAFGAIGMAYSEGKKYEAVQACYQAGNKVDDCNKIK
jgi:hypothetical protein